MEKMKDFFRQNLKVVLASVCGVLCLAGILTIVLGAGGNEGWIKAAFAALGVVFILIGCLSLLLAFTFKNDEEANFFLYDNKRRVNIPVEELDFARVDRMMTFAMSKLAPNPSATWTTNVFEKIDETFENDAFAPLVAYKMLYDLCEHSNESTWALFVMADESIVKSLSDALELNGDTELGKAFVFLHNSSEGRYDRTERFLIDNKKYIQNKMFKYVKNNIARF